MNTEEKNRTKDAKANHQQQFIWQILLPVVVASLAVLILTILSIYTAGNDSALNEKWAHISTIFMALPILLLGLIILALLILCSRLVKKITKTIPAYTGYIFHLFARTNQISDQMAQRSATPMIWSKANLAGFSRLVSIIFHIHNNPKE